MSRAMLNRFICSNFHCDTILLMRKDEKTICTLSLNPHSSMSTEVYCLSLLTTLTTDAIDDPQIGIDIYTDASS